MARTTLLLLSILFLLPTNAAIKKLQVEYLTNPISGKRSQTNSLSNHGSDRCSLSKSGLDFRKGGIWRIIAHLLCRTGSHPFHPLLLESNRVEQQNRRRDFDGKGFLRNRTTVRRMVGSAMDQGDSNKQEFQNQSGRQETDKGTNAAGNGCHPDFR